MDPHLHFTEEALRAQEGKKVPLKDEPGGRIIGEATMHYNEEKGILEAKFRVDDPKVAEFLKGNPRPVIFRPREFRAPTDGKEN